MHIIVLNLTSICNRYLSPISLWVRIPLIRCATFVLFLLAIVLSVFWIWLPLWYLQTLHATLCDKVCQWLATGGWFLRVLQQGNWPPRYSWDIVESGIRHHNSYSPQFVFLMEDESFCCLVLLVYLVCSCLYCFL